MVSASRYLDAAKRVPVKGGTYYLHLSAKACAMDAKNQLSMKPPCLLQVRLWRPSPAFSGLQSVANFECNLKQHLGLCAGSIGSCHTKARRKPPAESRCLKRTGTGHLVLFQHLGKIIRQPVTSGYYETIFFLLHQPHKLPYSVIPCLHFGFFGLAFRVLERWAEWSSTVVLVVLGHRSEGLEDDIVLQS